LRNAELLFASLFTSISFAIAILGFVLAIISLIANAYQFRASGGRVSVDTELDSVLAQISDETGKLIRLERIGLVKVSVRNTGRFGASVMEVGLRFPEAVGKLRKGVHQSTEHFWGLADEDESFWPSNPDMQNPNFPRRIEGGESESWVVLLSDVRQALEHNDIGSPGLRGIAVLATGKWVFSKQTVNPAEKMFFEGRNQPEPPAASPPLAPPKRRSRHRPIAHLITLHRAETPPGETDADAPVAHDDPMD
jgi:hypothetical protein